jgi:hypothetical protein
MAHSVEDSNNIYVNHLTYPMSCSAVKIIMKGLLYILLRPFYIVLKMLYRKKVIVTYRELNQRVYILRKISIVRVSLLCDCIP